MWQPRYSVIVALTGLLIVRIIHWNPFFLNRMTLCGTVLDCTVFILLIWNGFFWRCHWTSIGWSSEERLLILCIRFRLGTMNSLKFWRSEEHSMSDKGKEKHGQMSLQNEYMYSFNFSSSFKANKNYLLFRNRARAIFPYPPSTTPYHLLFCLCQGDYALWVDLKINACHSPIHLRFRG